jgi:hypothetical protein
MHSIRSVVAAIGVCALLAARCGCAGEVTSYFKSSADQNPRSDAGLLLTSDKVQFNADLALRAPDGSTLLQPRLTSAVALSDRLGLQTQVRLEDWNSHTEIPGANVDTSLRYRSSMPFLDDLEGRVWRSPDGQSGQTFRMGFNRRFVLRDPMPITLSAKASVESTIVPLQVAAAQIVPGVIDSAAGLIGADPAVAAGVARAETRRVRVETEVGGLLQRARGRSALNFKVDQATGATRATASSVAYRYAWRLGGAELGFNLKVRRTSDAEASAVDPSLGLNWKWQL